MIDTSASLLERLRQPGNRDWDRFVDLYSKYLYVCVSRFGVTGEDADDIVQEVFVNLLRDLPKFHYDPKLRFRGWLWRIIRNKVIDHQRKRGSLISSENLDAFPDRNGSHNGEELEEREYRQYLTNRAIELLKNDFEPKTWKLFWETTYESRPATAVAAAHGVKVNAVYLAKSRVLRRLRAELTGLLD